MILKTLSLSSSSFPLLFSDTNHSQSLLSDSRSLSFLSLLFFIILLYLYSLLLFACFSHLAEFHHILMAICTVLSHCVTQGVRVPLIRIVVCLNVHERLLQCCERKINLPLVQNIQNKYFFSLEYSRYVSESQNMTETVGLLRETTLKVNTAKGYLATLVMMLGSTLTSNQGIFHDHPISPADVRFIIR